MSHENYMKQALAQAEKALDADEVPVGAVLINAAGEIIASAGNHTIRFCDPSAHAEILALREAGQRLQNYRLPHTTLYVTIEPCVMCMGALIHARIKRVVFGAADPKWGAAGSLYQLAADERLNHHPEIIAGVCEPECRRLMRDFFKQKRRNQKSGFFDEQ
ncbi:MAG TPA: tRNA adenosine(34) deaminase TadA [Desulfosalsimonadaceae bacterium]|nr:tRNA adenosine(34) deaminase TadA [Desulfosalsimonadaceae bacterium]